MPRPTTKPTEFWDGFTAALRSQGEKRPPGNGWKLPAELASYWRIPVKLAAKRLNEGRKAGLLQYFNGCVFRDGKLRRTCWYRPTP